MRKKGEYYKKTLWCCEKLGIDCIEVIDTLNRDDYTNPPDGHWVQGGHTEVGKLLAEYVIKIMKQSRPQKEIGKHSSRGTGSVQLNG